MILILIINSTGNVNKHMFKSNKQTFKSNKQAYSQCMRIYIYIYIYIYILCIYSTAYIYSNNKIVHSCTFTPTTTNTYRTEPVHARSTFLEHHLVFIGEGEQCRKHDAEPVVCVCVCV